MDEPQQPADGSKHEKQQLHETLRRLGANKYDLLLPETQRLPRILNAGEKVAGVVYGRYTKDNGGHYSGRGLLAITDQRILLLDTKPLFLDFDDVSLDAVRGVKYSQAGFGETITLSTKLETINLHTFNNACAHQFVRAVEEMLFNLRKAEQ